jgi:hypothetical protein
MNNLQMDHLGVAMNIINGRLLTDDLLEEVLGMLLRLDGSLVGDGLADIKKQLESTIGIHMSTGEVMREKDHEPWFLDAKGSLDLHYWDSYKRLLRAEGKSSDVVRVLDEDTDNILTECGNPASKDSWQMRGLVMGDVQSGKTANYTGLIAKAADAGYKVIVLLTGMIEELRKQTQERLDEGFVGRNSRDVLGVNMNMVAIGAGIYRNKSANVLTSLDSDFLTRNARALGGIPLSNISEPVLFVIKKNKSPLENLGKWLNQQIPHGAEQHHLPLLIIDDEADNASVNTRKDEDPATINRLIRELIGKFSRCTYVGYTATPFANVFINPDNEKDLFPSDFIYSLYAPSNYIGPNSIFLDGGSHTSQLKDIDDAEQLIPYRHKKDLILQDIPESLKDAIRVFLLSCAMRDLRVEKLNHRSMLVNISRFTNVQAQISKKISDFLWDLQEEIRQYLLSHSWASHTKLLDLQRSWQEEYGEAGCSWDEIRHALHEAIASIKVVTINQKSVEEEKLNYSIYKNTAKGRRVIAVGGLTLSRGLTLHGLCVSYFYRNSKAYDTLLQMGRWFGYRPGYEELFRIWMDEDAQEWYAHIANAVNELRTDFRRMSANRLPPSRFGIRVQSHPDTLIITAQNKMRNSMEIENPVSFSAYGVETAFVPKAKKLHEENVKRVAALVDAITHDTAVKTVGRRYVWLGVDKFHVADFLTTLNISNMNMEFLFDPGSNSMPLVSFIADNEIEALEKWDICIPQGEGKPVAGIDVPLAGGQAVSICCRQRQFEKVPQGCDYLKLNKQKVGDTSDEMVEMDQGMILKVQEEWEKERIKDSGKGKDVPGYMYRKFRSRPLLTIHFIECVAPGPKNKKPEKMMQPDEIDPSVMVAISLSFPDFDPNGYEKPVPYRLNKVALRDIGINDDDEDED